MATTTKEMGTAEAALEAYGYTEEGDIFSKPNQDTQIWQRVERGFIRHERPAAGLVIGAPSWGRPSRLSPDLIEVPYTQTDKFRDVGGLHPAAQPEAFEWTWPAHVVAEIYAHGHTSEFGQAWKRNEAGELVPDTEGATA